MRNVIWEPFGQEETKQDWALWERDLRVTGQLYQLQLFLIHVGDNKVCLKSPGPQAEELQLLSAWKASSKTCLPLLVTVLYPRATTLPQQPSAQAFLLPFLTMPIPI